MMKFELAMASKCRKILCTPPITIKSGWILKLCRIGLNLIKIGTGSPPERNQIINSLQRFSNLIKLVSENHSGSGSHTAAATRIAFRKEILENTKVYEPKDGEIAWVQQESRRLSKGLVTIDKQLAHQILIGKRTMSDAIKAYTSKIKM